MNRPMQDINPPAAGSSYYPRAPFFPNLNQNPHETEKEYLVRAYVELRMFIKVKIKKSCYIELGKFIKRPGGLDIITKRAFSIMVDQQRKLSTALTDLEMELEGRS